ncbi:hypothetical protein F4861DRAFT_533134 [Xylaria intraflava]|nr:hypothetical protein F4861DRAFT_533134 [Xylaria intraflava]
MRRYERTEELPDSNINDSGMTDIRDLTVLPGFVDAHAHIFLHGYSETPTMNQMRNESLVNRVVRATNYAEEALGLRHADVHFRDTISRGISPGPRMFVPTDCIASSSGYEFRHENSLPGVGNSVLRILDTADGVYGVRAAVHRRLGANADIIKSHADYEKRSVYPLFTQKEMDAMVADARMGRASIAAHAESLDAIIIAAKAGVTSIEHSFIANNEALDTMTDNKIIFVPRLSVYDQEPQGARWGRQARLRPGGGTGAFPHGDNIRELELVLAAGIPLADVLQAAALHGWEACGTSYAAEIVSFDGHRFKDPGALRRVGFIMKDGQIYKNGA